MNEVITIKTSAPVDWSKTWNYNITCKPLHEINRTHWVEDGPYGKVTCHRFRCKKNINEVAIIEENE